MGAGAAAGLGALKGLLIGAALTAGAAAAAVVVVVAGAPADWANRAARASIRFWYSGPCMDQKRLIKVERLMQWWNKQRMTRY